MIEEINKAGLEHLTKVVGLRGEVVAAPQNQPAANVVEKLRELLALAESGQLRGVGIVTCERDAKFRFYWRHDDSHLVVHGLSSGILCLSVAWANDLTGPNEGR